MNPKTTSTEVEAFAQHWWDTGQPWTTSWLGMQLIQNPCDLIAIAEILWNTRPQVLIETGTHTGASAHLYALLMSQCGGEEIITVDVDHHYLEADGRDSALPIRWVRASSLDVDPIALAYGRRAMVILDSLHTTAHVAAELDHFAPVVSPGCYLVCQDTFIGGHPVTIEGLDEGPWPAVQAFTEAHPEFRIDDRVEPMFTCAPDGYLFRDPASTVP